MIAESVPFVLCFDVEPDEPEVALEPRPWIGFERLLERTASLRRELADKTGRVVQFNWFLRMDPQIAYSHGSAGWVSDRYRDQLRALRREGDTIGLHPHAWRWMPSARRWVADHGDADWVDQCIRTSFETYETAFGETCRSVRLGDRFITARVVRLVAALGARYDVTVEPGAPPLQGMHGAAATGLIPSMRRAPSTIYRPAVDDALRATSENKPDDAGIWMIPLTSLDPDPILPGWRRVARRIKHPKGPRRRPAQLSAAIWDARPFWASVEQELARSPRPYVAFAERSDMPIRSSQLAAVEEKLAFLIASPLISRLAFTTAENLVVRVTASQPVTHP